MVHRPVCALLPLLASACALLVAPLRAEGPSFSRDVLPILKRSCQGCHQPASKQSGLDLTTFASFRAGGGRGSPFQPGDGAQSLIVRYLTGAMKPSMPLGAPLLPAHEVDLVRRWIDAGAVDDSAPDAGTDEPPVYRQPPVITALRFSPDGQWLAVSGNREVLLHRADGSGIGKRLTGKAERILSIAFSADGALLVAGGGTPARFGEVQFWDVAGARLLRSARISGDTVFGASLAPDGSKVVVGCADHTVRAFETATAKELYKMVSHENWVLATVFGVDSKRFVSVGRDRAAKLVDALGGQFLENINQLRGELAAVARHPGKDLIAVGGEERIPYLYVMDRPRNMKVGEEATLVRKLERQEGAIFAMDWSPDGKRLAIAGAAPNVVLYDPETGDRLAACSGHSAGIYAVAFSPDGTRLATGGFDGHVRLYDAADCRLRRAFVSVPLDRTAADAEGARSGGGQ